MPQVIPVVVKILATKIIAGITVAAIVKTAAVYAISQMLTKSARSKASGLGSGSDLVMTREPAPVRRVVYGETRVSGPMAFANISGDKNSALCLAILLAAHECDAVGAYLVDDEQVTPGTDGDVTTGTYASKLKLVSHLGDQTTADYLLMANAPGVWTSAHVLRGITYLAAKLTYDTDVYSGGLPNLSVILRGKKLYDPRTSTVAWSSNPALILRDYLTNADYGLSCTADEIDDALIIAAANICDEAVALKSGGSEARYRCNGTFTTDAEPASIIEAILTTMAGSITYSGGKFRVYAGAYSAPTVTLDEDDMAGAIEFQPATGIREACNIVKGAFTSPSDLYQPRDFPRFADASHITADGEEIATDLDLAWVSSAAQAQRLAKIYERKARLGGTVTLKCKLSAFRCQTGETIAVSNTRLGWSEKVFTVQEWRFAIAGDGSLGVELTCRETASSIYDWSAYEEGILTTTSQFSNPPTTMENVTGAVANSQPGTLSDLNGGGLNSGQPGGSIAVQQKGGTATIGGYGPLDSIEETPPRRWLSATLSGTLSMAFGGSCFGCGAAMPNTETHAYSGSNTLNPATGFSETIGAVHTFSTCAGSGTEAAAGLIDEGCSTTTTHTTQTRTGTASCYQGWVCSYLCDGPKLATGTISKTLGNEDTEPDAYARMLAATDDWAAGNSAIYTQRVTGLSFIRRKLRYRTEHSEPITEQQWVPDALDSQNNVIPGHWITVTIGQNIYPTLTGLVRWWTYRVRVSFEQRPVDESGAATGSWESAGTDDHVFIANLDGEGGFDWVEVEAPLGYELRVGDTVVLSE